MKALIAAVLTAAIVAPTAFSVGVAKDPRVPALQRSVRVLQTQMRSVRAEQACEKDVLPVASFSGYLYTADQGTTIRIDSALDTVSEGETPDEYLSIVDNACIKARLRTIRR
jgi:hypothetical protein